MTRPHRVNRQLDYNVAPSPRLLLTVLAHTQVGEIPCLQPTAPARLRAHARLACLPGLLVNSHRLPKGEPQILPQNAAAKTKMCLRRLTNSLHADIRGGGPASTLRRKYNLNGDAPHCANEDVEKIEFENKFEIEFENKFDYAFLPFAEMPIKP